MKNKINCLIVISVMFITYNVSAQMPDTSLYMQKQKALENFQQESKYYQTNIGGFNNRIKNDLYKVEVKENIVKLYDKKRQALISSSTKETDQTKKNDIQNEIKGLTDSITSELNQVKTMRTNITGFIKEAKALELEYLGIRYLMYQYQNNEITGKKIDEFNEEYRKKFNKN